MGKTYEIVEKCCEEIAYLGPTHEEINSYATQLENTYGVLTFCKGEDNPLHIRLHNTWKRKFGGRIHIDVISGEIHLMLDKDHALDFINFLKRRRKLI